MITLSVIAGCLLHGPGIPIAGPAHREPAGKPSATGFW